MDNTYNILEGLGAFEFDSVKERIEETKNLIEAKLKVYENEKRQELGLDPLSIEKEVSQITRTEIISQGGSAALNISA